MTFKQRWTGLEKPGGKSTVYIRTSLPESPARSFDMSSVIVSCAIGCVKAFCAIRVPVMISVLVIRNASTNIGFEVVIGCSRRSVITTTRVTKIFTVRPLAFTSIRRFFITERTDFRYADLDNCQENDRGSKETRILAVKRKTGGLPPEDRPT